GHVVRRQVDPPAIAGRHVAHWTHTSSHGDAVACEHEIAPELRVRLERLPTEEIGIERSGHVDVGRPEVRPTRRTHGALAANGHGTSSSGSCHPSTIE